MKKKLFPVLLLLVQLILNLNNSFAQSGQWIWIKGDSISNANPVYGTMGVADSLNSPGGIYGPAEWKDTQGNFYIFGGSDSYGAQSAMWKYDPQMNQWTWVRGSQLCCLAGVYGIKGVPSVNNYPGSRGYGCATWVDTSGNFWLFGGVGHDAYGNGYFLNDLWRYNPLTDEWTWMKGSNLSTQPGIYGVQGVGDTANTPGGRSECTVTWVDMENNLWLYGGNNAPDDLWKYSIISNTWTWVKGSTSGTIAPVYGTVGIPSLTNTPGSRYNYAKWKDAQDNLWMFGGMGLSFYSPRNDLWKYNPASNEWTWMNGSNTSGDPGIYNSYCSPDSISNPKARFENRAVWTDGNGKFWMMGGLLDGINKNINDMWYYTPATNEWTWVSGDTILNYAGFYGIQGTSNPSNNPSDRGGAVSWMDDQCHLWLFGGWSNDFNLKNDVWKFIPGDSCGACSLPALSASNTSLCEKFCIDFFDSSTNNPTSWQWQFPGGSPSSSTDQNPTNICYQVPGIFDVTLITTSANGNDTLTLSNYITVNTTPPFPTITQVGYTLTSSPATSYQWQLNAADIPGATAQSYTVLQSGNYTVVIGDSVGCVNSASIEVVISGINEVMEDADISIYPNPTNGDFVVEIMNAKAEEIQIQIFNAIGEVIFFTEEKMIANHIEIDLSNKASGAYIIQITSRKTVVRNKLMLIQ